MPLVVRHAKVSVLPDAGPSELVQASDWNADHVVDEVASLGDLRFALQAPGGRWLECDAAAWRPVASYTALVDALKLEALSRWREAEDATGGLVINAIAYGNGQFLAGSAAGRVFVSDDGIAWLARLTGGTAAVRGMVYMLHAGLWVAVVGGAIYTSTDGVTWKARTSGFGTTNILAVAYKKSGLAVAVGEAGKIATSADGVTWTARTSGFGTTVVRDVCAGGAGYVAVGDAGKIATSADGVTWTARVSGVASNLTKVMATDVGFIAAGAGGVVLTSTDGVTWTARDAGLGGANVLAMAYGGGLALAVAKPYRLAVSWDGGVTWSGRPDPLGAGRGYASAAVYGGGVFLVGAGGVVPGVLRSGPLLRLDAAGLNFKLDGRARGLGDAAAIYAGVV